MSLGGNESRFITDKVTFPEGQYGTAVPSSLVVLVELSLSTAVDTQLDAVPPIGEHVS